MHQARDVVFLSQDETRRLFSKIAGKRDRVLFPLAYHHGLRASEVSLLLREDFDRHRGRIYIHRLKGSISGVFPIEPEDAKRLQSYLKSREDESPYLFVSNRRAPLERRSYWDLMQRYGQLADIPVEKLRFHALRHSIAVHLLDAGADIAFVRDRLGHVSIQNTMRYMRYTTATRDSLTRRYFNTPWVV